MTTPRDPWRLVATLPSTNLRILCSLVMALGTGVRVIGLGWNPSTEWLGFLVIWAGLDIGQFISKRMTNTPTPPSSAPEGGGGG